MNFFTKLFDGADFPARWHCGDWSDAHGYLHIVSDILIFGAYLAIPMVLLLFVSRRRDVPFHGIFLLFGAFIVACGLTHLNEAIIFWHPFYRFAGVTKALTAAISLATVVALVRVMPEAMSLRSPHQLEEEVERRTAALLQAEKRFKTVVEASPSAMVMVGSDATILLVNHRTEELFGYDRDELVGASLECLVPARFRPAHAKHVHNFLRHPSSRGMGIGRDLFGQKKDGSEFPIEIGLNPIEGPEEVLVLASITDITERKRIETKREQLIVDLRRSNEELEQFAYVASHDLQEPLRAVVNYTQLLDEEYSEKLDDEAHKYMQYIVEGGLRMQQLVNDLLAYSRVDTKKTSKVLVSLQSVLDRALENLKLAVSDCDATITHEPLPEVVADSSQLLQLLQNLIANALKFRRTDVTPTVHVGAKEEATRWVFSVRDNGIGFDTTYEARIFRPFQRLHRRGAYEGSGIGLSIAKKIVERHRGAMWVESVVGEGSTFYFTLPKSPLPEEPHHA